MPSTPTNSTFIPTQEEDSPRKAYTIYTGESRQPFRERIQRLRDHRGSSKLDTPIPRKRSSSSSIGNHTPPPMPVFIAECPGAPRKGKVSELRRASPLELDFKEAVIPKRKSFERAQISLDDCADIPPQGRKSPLRKSWGPTQPAETIEDLQPLIAQFAFAEGEKKDGAKKIFRFKGI